MNFNTSEIVKKFLYKKPKYFWVWIGTHYKAAICKLKRNIVRDKTVRAKLVYKELWYRGMSNEIEWWAEWLTTDEGKKWKDQVGDPQYPLQDYLLLKRIQDILDESVSILDVGSGPITHLGYTYPGKNLKIIAIDPLAKEYNQVLTDAKITPPIKTIYGSGEKLLYKFEPDSFDFVYASNSLDHSYDPILIIKNMIAVVKKNGFVLLRHYKNEAISAEYDGLHQWNFDIKQNDLIIWNNMNEYNITRLFSHQVQIECYYDLTNSYGFFDHTDWIICTLKKL